MFEYCNDFKKYVNRIDEVGGYEDKPGWIANKLGAGKRNADALKKMFTYGQRIAKYLRFDIKPDEIVSGLKGDYDELRSPGQQGFIQLIKSIYASKNNKPPVGLTRGQIEAMMTFLKPAVVSGLIGVDLAKSPEAFAIFLGQMAQSMDGYINLEPGFQREVQEYYNHTDKMAKSRSEEELRDARAAGKVRRGGLAYVASQIKQMKLSNDTIQDIEKAITRAMQIANKAGRSSDAAALGQFISGLKGTP